MTPLPAQQALDAYFLEARCRLLDLAAIMDRIDRGANPAAVQNDPRVQKIRTAVALLLQHRGDRAEAIQKTFSQEYDPNWKCPEPRI